MKKMFVAVFVAVLAVGAFADVLQYRNGAAVSGVFVGLRENTALFVVGSDTLVAGGWKTAEIRLDDGGRVVFDPVLERFVVKKMKAKVHKESDKTRVLAVTLGLVSGMLAYDSYQGAQEIDEAASGVSSGRNRFMAAFYGAVSVLCFVFAAK